MKNKGFKYWFVGENYKNYTNTTILIFEYLRQLFYFFTHGKPRIVNLFPT
jgi:hypothetical protein